MHLICDTYSENQALMRDKQLLRGWLVEMAKIAEMAAYGEPQVIDFPWPGSYGTALSGVCFLGESSITIHTYPEKEFVFIDVFSCKDFDGNRVLKYINKTFRTKKPEVIILERGVNMKTGAIIPAKLKGR